MEHISERIEAVIKSHNLTSASFADQIGVQRSSISHVLSGRNKPSMTFIQKILENFPRVDANWLITGDTKSAAVSTGPETLNTNTSKVTTTKGVQNSNSKRVEKIVVFYTDKTFEEYHQP